MPSASITIEDLPSLDPNKPSPFKVELDYGVEFNENSRAHAIIRALAEAVLEDARANHERVGYMAGETVQKPTSILIEGGN